MIQSFVIFQWVLPLERSVNRRRRTRKRLKINATARSRGVLRAEQVGELVAISRIAGSWQTWLVSTFSYSRISREASAIDSTTPLGLQAPG
jgi:hypothetical protein